jgi:hypothetical protein
MAVNEIVPKPADRLGRGGRPPSGRAPWLSQFIRHTLMRGRFISEGQSEKLPGIQLPRDLREFWRQLLLPECVHCGSSRIQPSAPGLRGAPLSWVGLLPYRCERCLRRSYLRARVLSPRE